MPRNGSGTYSLPESPFVAGTVISSAAVNDNFNDIAIALTGSLPRDGQAGMTGQFKLPDGSSLAPALSFNNEPTSGLTRIGAGQVGLTILGIQIATFSATGLTITGTESSTSITGLGTVPIGTIVDFSGATAPTGWILCFGQNISRTTYAALFTLLGIFWGAGDGSTTFGIPDCRDYVLVGKGDMGGSDAGRLTTAFYGASPTVLGNPGGTQSRSLITANLPAYTPTGTITGSVAIQPGVAQNPSVSVGVMIAGGSTSITAGFAGNAQGGTSTAFSQVQPSIIMNKIIYAGA